jgi:3-hydroxyisobutyrate dehydrogenase-like beta-hydroxyacid dehydrogenase
MAGGRIGFIGLGVMGLPMCRHLARKCGGTVVGFDRSDAPFAELAGAGVQRAESLAHLAATADVIFMALPSGEHVATVANGADGLLAHARPGHIVVDLGTSPVALAQRLSADFAGRGAAFADAPIARTRQAAEDAALSVMVGSDADTFEHIRPLLACFATDITHCGPVGSGQMVKILNNMVLVETVVALSEALAIARAAGLDGKLLFETLMKGSADSFALRNHGMKAMLPGTFPERAFSTAYALKDIGYALALAAEHGIAAQGATLARDTLAAASADGHADRYWPVIAETVRAKKP